MSRSLKKGPYINVKLEKKVLAMTGDSATATEAACARLLLLPTTNVSNV